jgi:hypothetical protein
MTRGAADSIPEKASSIIYVPRGAMLFNQTDQHVACMMQDPERPRRTWRAIA